MAVVLVLFAALLFVVAVRGKPDGVSHDGRGAGTKLLSQDPFITHAARRSRMIDVDVGLS